MDSLLQVVSTLRGAVTLGEQRNALRSFVELCVHQPASVHSLNHTARMLRDDATYQLAVSHAKALWTVAPTKAAIWAAKSKTRHQSEANDDDTRSTDVVASKEPSGGMDAAQNAAESSAAAAPAPSVSFSMLLNTIVGCSSLPHTPKAVARALQLHVLPVVLLKWRIAAISSVETGGTGHQVHHTTGGGGAAAAAPPSPHAVVAQLLGDASQRLQMLQKRLVDNRRNTGLANALSLLRLCEEFLKGTAWLTSERDAVQGGIGLGGEDLAAAHVGFVQAWLQLTASWLWASNELVASTSSAAGRHFRRQAAATAKSPASVIIACDGLRRWTSFVKAGVSKLPVTRTVGLYAPGGSSAALSLMERSLASATSATQAFPIAATQPWLIAALDVACCRHRVLATSNRTTVHWELLDAAFFSGNDLTSASASSLSVLSTLIRGACILNVAENAWLTQPRVLPTSRGASILAPCGVPTSRVDVLPVSITDEARFDEIFGLLGRTMTLRPHVVCNALEAAISFGGDGAAVAAFIFDHAEANRRVDALLCLAIAPSLASLPRHSLANGLARLLLRASQSAAPVDSSAAPHGPATYEAATLKRHLGLLFRRAADLMSTRYVAGPDRAALLTTLFAMMHQLLPNTFAPPTTRTAMTTIAPTTTAEATAAPKRRAGGCNDRQHPLQTVSVVAWLPDAPVVSSLLATFLDSASGEVFRPAWSLLACFPYAPYQRDALEAAGIAGVLREADASEMCRRAILTHLAPEGGAAIASFVQTLVSDSASVLASKADAFLALRFSTAAGVSNASVDRLLTDRVALESFVRKDEHSTTEDYAALATCLAAILLDAAKSYVSASSGCLVALPVLLTSQSGTITRALATVLESRKDTGFVLGMWNACLTHIFALTSTGGSSRESVSSVATSAKATTASSSAAAAAPPNAQEQQAAAVQPFPPGSCKLLYTLLGSGVLEQISRVDPAALLAQLAAACGHSSVLATTDDSTLMLTDVELRGRYRDRTGVVLEKGRRLFARLLGPNRVGLVEQHLAAAVTSLLQMMPLGHSSCARGIVILCSMVPAAGRTAALSVLLHRAEESIMWFNRLDALDQAVAASSAADELTWVDGELQARKLVKVYTDKPPKGVTEDDYEATKRKELAALKTARQQLSEQFRARCRALSATVTGHRATFATVRLLGEFRGTGANSFEVNAPLYTLLQQTVSLETSSPMLRQLALQSAAALLHHTDLGRGLVATQIVRVCGLLSKKLLTTDDVNETVALAVLLRQCASSHALPPALVAAVLPLAVGAFELRAKASRSVPIPAQVQTMSIFAAMCGNDKISNKNECASFLVKVLENYPSVYRTSTKALEQLASTMRSGVDLQPISDGLMTGSDLVREAGATAFLSFMSNAANPGRDSEVLAAVCTRDSRDHVINTSKKILASASFEWQEGDWIILAKMLERYHANYDASCRVSKALKEHVSRFREAQDAWLSSVTRTGGLAAATAIQSTASHFTPESVILATQFLSSVVEKPGTEDDLLEAVMESGRHLFTICEVETLKTLAPKIIEIVKRPPPGATGQHLENHGAITLTWQSDIAARLKENALLVAAVESLETLVAKSQTRLVHHTICECAFVLGKSATPGSDIYNRLVAFAGNCLKQVLNSTTYAKKKAHAYGLAGVVQGMGLRTLRTLDFFNQLVSAAKDKQPQRSGCMIALETMADTLGKVFEPYALALTQQILDALSEKDAKISEVADDAAKAMMRSLSDVGLYQMVGRLLKGLESDQTKKRTPALNLIGYVAFCSPKQLSSILPEIISKVSENLFDANAGVAGAAFNALKRVAGVVSCPSIQEHVDIILESMRNPSETEAALDALLYTRFNSAIDPASLSLIMPVVFRGLSERERDTRGKAAQITASVVSLVSHAASLAPYAEELTIKLRGTIVDPHASVRATSAKALAALAYSLGGQRPDEVVDWCFTVFARASSSAERGGAAQTLCELASAVGETMLEALQPRILEGCAADSPSSREGFVTIFVYAPGTLNQTVFTRILPTYFPVVLEALSDPVDRVRDAALLAGTNIISIYGTRNLSLVVEPLVVGVVNENTTQRQSSLLLTSKLLIHLVQQIKRKTRINEAAAASSPEGMSARETSAKSEEVANAEAEEDDDDDDAPAGMLKLNSARDLEKTGVSILGTLEEKLGAPAFHRFIAALFLARNEMNANVRAEVTTAWQVCVASPRAAVTAAFSCIVELLVKYASSARPECVELAEKALEFTCQRLHEISDQLLVAISKVYLQHEHQRRMQLGALVCIAEMIPFADSHRLLRLGPHLVACVLPALQHQDDAIREVAGTVFERVGKTAGPKWVETMVEKQLGVSVVGVVEVIRVRPTTTLPAVFRLLNAQSTYGAYEAKLIREIVQLDEVVNDLPKYYTPIVEILHVCETDEVPEAKEAMSVFARSIPEEYVNGIVTEFKRKMKVPASRGAVIRTASAFAIGVDAGAVDAIDIILRILIEALGDGDAEVRRNAGSGLVEVAAALEEKALDDLDEEQSADAVLVKRATGRYLVQFVDPIQSTLVATARAVIGPGERELPALALPKVFDTINGFYTRALDYGTSEQKQQAVEGIQDLLTYGPASVVQQAGMVIITKFMKTLVDRNDPVLIVSVLQLLLQMGTFNLGERERIISMNLATALIGPAMNDHGEARLCTLRLVLNLIKRMPTTPESMLSSIATKMTLISASPVARGSTARFASLVLRRGVAAFPQAARLFDFYKPIWEAAGEVTVAASTGSVIGSLARTNSLGPDVARECASKALQMMLTKGSAKAVGGIACLYQMLENEKSFAKLEPDFAPKIAAALTPIVPVCALDPTTASWVLRLAAALVQRVPTIASGGLLRIADLLDLLRKVNRANEVMMATAAFVVRPFSQAWPSKEAELQDVPQEPSSMMQSIGFYDVDIEDEAAIVAATAAMAA